MEDRSEGVQEPKVQRTFTVLQTSRKGPERESKVNYCPIRGAQWTWVTRIGGPLDCAPTSPVDSSMPRQAPRLWLTPNA